MYYYQHCMSDDSHASYNFIHIAGDEHDIEEPHGRTGLFAGKLASAACHAFVVTPCGQYINVTPICETLRMFPYSLSKKTILSKGTPLCAEMRSKCAVFESL